MNGRYAGALLLILAVLITAFTAQYVGRRYLQGDSGTSASIRMHDYLHEQLDIDSALRSDLAPIEKRYNETRVRLEGRIQEANEELAVALANAETLTPAVQQAIDDIHEAMGELQRATVEHLLELRAALPAGQDAELRELIADALRENAGADD